jgi:ArsR family transcriptional regulator
MDVDESRIIPAMALKQPPVDRERGVCCKLPEVEVAWAEQTADLLKALCDPTRLTMAAALWRAHEPICICDFTAALELSQPTISHHMGKLRAAGVVEAEKHGIWVYYRIRDGLPPSTRQLLEQVLD